MCMHSSFPKKPWRVWHLATEAVGAFIERNQARLPRMAAATGLPSISSPLLYINIGSNVNPILPPTRNTSVGVLVFEPIVPHLIAPRDRQTIVAAAVGSTSGFATMGVYNIGGLSSSLSSPAIGTGRRWAQGNKNTTTVRVFGMADVLHAYRRHVIWYLKTDMQGHDFNALKSAGHLLRKVPYIMAEAGIENQHSYANDENDYCRHHLPLFTSLGYAPMGLVVSGGRWLLSPGGGLRAAQEYCDGLQHVRPRAGGLEGNGFWRRTDAILGAPFETQFPRQSTNWSQLKLKHRYLPPRLHLRS